ncbi:MAG: DegV family protein [Lachnospiraceae bacterium]|nr:DegV family protein [Lachnospiraceae bacterium]
MKPIGIVTDSHSGISQKRAKELGVKVLPMPFYFGEECYYEDVSLSREEFYRRLQAGETVSTSQPSPAEVMALWDEALLEYEQILYMPISSGLSGSCATAALLAGEEPYDGRVLVVDNGRVSALLHRAVLDGLELIEEGYSAQEIKEILEASRADMVIYIAVQTLENLKKGGRITPATAAIGTILNIKPVLKFDVGTLDSYAKCRGFQKAKKTMLEAIAKDLSTTFASWEEKGEAYVVVASSASEEDTLAWVEEVKAAFPGREVMWDPLSFGTSCHIGYGGLGIGISCKPPRPLK